MIKSILLAVVVPFMTQHRNIVPSDEVTTNFYGSVTGIVNEAYIEAHGGGGGGGGVDTNAVIDIIHATVDGAARPLPKYLHALDFADSYPEAAAEYYRSRGDGKTDGGCSAVRDGGFLYRNFDYPFDDRAEFVVKMVAGPNRFASVGVAQVGTNLTEQTVTSGKWSKWYKALPGATVDGINEHGVVAEINVVDGDPQTSGWSTSGDIHPLAAVRWALDNATNSEHAATYLAANIKFPQGWTQNFHYMIADEDDTWVVENGTAVKFDKSTIAMFRRPVLVNFRILWYSPGYGQWTWNPISALREYYHVDDTFGTYLDAEGYERFDELNGRDYESITNVWYSKAYLRDTIPPRYSDLRDSLDYLDEIYDAWDSHPKEYFRGKTNNGIPWWQTVHTSIYDITNRILRVSVQETDDWYVFQVPATGGKIDAYTKAEADGRFVKRRPETNDGSIGWDDIGGFSISSSDSIALDGYTRFSGRTEGISFLDLDDRPTTLSGYGIEDAKIENDTITLGNQTISPILNGENISVANVISYGIIESTQGIYKKDSVSGSSSEVVYGISTNGTDYLHADVNLKPWGDSLINASNPAFSNAVLSVGIDTNTVAQIGELKDFLDDLPVGTVGTSLGGIILALLGAAALLKKKTSLLKSDGTAEDQFATDLLGKQVAITAIDARIKTNPESAAEPTNVVTINDNAPKTVTVATATADSLAVTFGTARNGGLRICELYILNGTADTDLTFDAATVSFVSTGDSFPACEAGINYFVFAEVAANLWKVTRETLKSITTPTPVAAA